MPPSLRFSSVGLLFVLLASPTFTIALPSSALTADPADNVILVLDTSKSMRGIGINAKDIFSDVIRMSKQLTNEHLDRGDTFTLITFDEDVVAYPTVLIDNSSSIQRIDNILDHIQANGNKTYTSKALLVALQEADSISSRNPEGSIILVILTDGINDPPQGAADTLSLTDIASRYEGKPWYVYQIHLGEVSDPDLDRAVVLLGGKTISDPGAIRIKSLPEVIASDSMLSQTSATKDTSPAPENRNEKRNTKVNYFIIGLASVLILALLFYFIARKNSPLFENGLYLQSDDYDNRTYLNEKVGLLRSSLYANRDFYLDRSLSDKGLVISPEGSVIQVQLKDEVDLVIEGEVLKPGQSKTLYVGESLKFPNGRSVTLSRDEVESLDDLLYSSPS